MRHFFLTAKPGCDLYTAIENPDYNHSEILEVDRDGTILGHIPYLSDTDHMYNPEPDPAYQKPQVIITQEGEVEIPTIVPEGKLAVGENPFIQLIYRYVRKTSPVTEEDIIRHMTMEKKHLPNNKEGHRRIRGYIRIMHSGSMSGLLLIQNGEYVTGLKLKTGRHLVDVKSGYDPIEYHMMLYIENKGIVSRDELHRLFIDRLKWARHTKTVEYYITKIIENKYVKIVGENWFQYRKFPEILK
jgi:hypothetical protein